MGQISKFFPSFCLRVGTAFQSKLLRDCHMFKTIFTRNDMVIKHLK